MRIRAPEAILKWNLTKFTCEQRLVEFNDSLTRNRTPGTHQMHSLIGPGHVTAGNPSSLRIVIAIVLLGTRFATFAISLSENRKYAIARQALHCQWYKTLCNWGLGYVTGIAYWINSVYHLFTELI